MWSARRTAACVVLIAGVALGPACGGSEPDQVRGQGYSFELPKGWKDRSDTERVKQLDVIGFSPDTLATGDRVEGFYANFNVIRQGSLDRGVSAGEVARASVQVLRNPRLLGAGARRQVRDFKVRDLSALERTRLGGEPAVAYTYTASRGGRLLRLRQLIAVHEGAAFTLTFTALREQFDQDVDDLAPIVSSWRWDSE